MAQCRRLRKLLLGAGGATLAGFALWWLLLGHSAPAVFHIISDEEKEDVPPVLDQPWRNELADKITALHGLIEEEVLLALGQPNQAGEFPIEKAVGEFRIELLNTYPPWHLRSWGVRIREWQWKYREFSIAVWFHRVNGRWVVLDTCRWKKGVVF